jgi:outer membrane protein OmpA-like peptidoglycan-associated protein
MRPKIPALLTAALVAALIIPSSLHAAMTSMRAPLFGAADEAMAAADALDARLLAPISYAEAMSQYERADDTFQRAGSVDSIRRYLARAEEKFTRSSEAAEIAAQALEAMIRARAAALQTDTASFAPKEWKDGENAFGQATKSLERGSMKSAERYSDRAEKAYRDGELIAIKANYLNETRDFIAMAMKLKADRYAPTSLGNALALLDAAEKELNNNRYDTDKPRSLAADAKHNALHAIYIAKLENRIRNRELNLESILLGWEASIARLGDALDMPVYFDYGEEEAIATLLEGMTRLRLEKDALAQTIEDREQELAGLNEQVAKMQELLGGGNQTIEELEVLLVEQKKRLEQQAMHRERFATVEGLFAPDQATVLRQGDTVIIRMIGLNFDSGAASLTAEHQQILAVLEQAISEFPESRVVVEGHTDAFGSDADNLGLSQARADAVAQHLLTRLPISPMNLNAMGYGETRPVANNETAEGRKRNRRIDVVIKPQWIDTQTVARVQVPEPIQLPDLALDR